MKPPPFRPAEPPPPPDDTLGRLAVSTARLETEVSTVRRDVSDLRSSMASQATAVGKIAGQARDLSLIKKIAVGSLFLLLPYLAAAGYQLAVGPERLDVVRADLTEHKAEDGHNGTAEDITAINLRLQAIDHSSAEHAKSLGKLEKALRPRKGRGRNRP